VPCVATALSKNQEFMKKKIKINDNEAVIPFAKVTLPFGWLGNMAPYPVQYDGMWWKTTEALFQALRFPENSPVRVKIWKQGNPMAAKMVAKPFEAERVVVRCSDKDLENMRLCLELKIKTHRKVREGLMATKGKILVENVTNRRRKNEPWGMKLVDGVWVGENLLEALWMEIRDEGGLN